MKFLLLALLALVAVATAVKPKKYRVVERRDLRKKDVDHHTSACEGLLDYRCGSGECIQAEWECDTDRDCLDGSDESDCTADCTGSHKFQCADNKTCISFEFRCDGDTDCADHSDEKGCELVQCSPGEVKCADRLCVEQEWFCDGFHDCPDDSDEQNCPNGTVI